MQLRRILLPRVWGGEDGDTVATGTRPHKHHPDPRIGQPNPPGSHPGRPGGRGWRQEASPATPPAFPHDSGCAYIFLGATLEISYKNPELQAPREKLGHTGCWGPTQRPIGGPVLPLGP